MVFLGIGKCAVCKGVSLQSEVTDQGEEGFRSLIVLECPRCGNSHLDLSDFGPQLDMAPFSVGNSVARSIISYKN